MRGVRAGAFLGIMCIGYGVWACVWPQSHLWNARLLPFFYLTRYLLVAIGVAEIGLFVARLPAPRRRPDARVVPLRHARRSA